MRLLRALAASFALTVLLGGAASAARTAPYECAAHARAFAFWIGERDLFVGGEDGGRGGGHRDAGGCVVVERWEGDEGRHGTSLTWYDARTGLWHHDSVDPAQGSESLAGTVDTDGVMRLAGTDTDPGGRVRPARATWTLLPGGSVRRVVERNEDGVWKTVADVLHRRGRGSI